MWSGGSSHTKLGEEKDAKAKQMEQAEKKIADDEKAMISLNQELEALRAKLAEMERCVASLLIAWKMELGRVEPRAGG